MASSSKKESHRHAVVFFLRRWVLLLMAIMFSTAFWLCWVQNQLAVTSPAQLHKPDNHQAAQENNPLPREVTQHDHSFPRTVAQSSPSDLVNEAQLGTETRSKEDHPFPGMVAQNSSSNVVNEAQAGMKTQGKEDHPFPEMVAQKSSSIVVNEAQVVMKTQSKEDLQVQGSKKVEAQSQTADAKSAQTLRFLQPRNAPVRKDERVTPAVDKRAKYIGPWKMTFASAAPELARDFCMKYLGAEHYYFTFPGMPSCAELQWVTFPGKPLEGEVPKPWRKTPFRFFQFHFVKHHRRPTGPMTIGELEQKFKSMHGNFTTYNQFMDTRVTLEADDLDPIAARLVHDKQPFLAKENVDGSFSLIMEVPHAILVEVVSPKLTVLKPKPWSRCDSSLLQAAEVDWNLVASQLHVGVQDVRPRGFVYASTKPQAAANLHATYFLGQHTENSSLLLERGNGSCFEAQAVEWSQPEGVNKFEFQWVHWPAAPTASGALKLQDVERYQLQLRSNFSMAHANKWDHYMDFHAGLFIEDCDPVIERLRANGVPHFLTPHFMKFMAVFIQDEGGLVYEVVCHKFSLA